MQVVLRTAAAAPDDLVTPSRSPPPARSGSKESESDTSTPRRAMIRALQLLAAVLVLAACTRDVTGPQFNLVGLPAGLDVQFAIEPGEVRQHQPFTASLTIANTTADTIRVVTSHGCLVILHVTRDGQRIPFQGSWWGCTAAITTHTFAPGETHSQTWNLRAELYGQHPGDVEGAPAPKGTYLVQAEFDTGMADGQFRKPLVERTLQVK